MKMKFLTFNFGKSIVAKSPTFPWRLKHFSFISSRTPARGVVGGWAGGHVPPPPSVGTSGNFRKFQNIISTAHMHDDVMGFECIRSSENY